LSPMNRSALILALALIATNASAQTPANDSAKGPAFEDNSFLVEEAYNQDAGVVQHISGLSIDHMNKSYEYDFTQEWPVGSIRHQLSYMIPLAHSGIPTSTTGIGDVMLNYRYQLVGDGDAAVAVAPRFSLALPSGSWKTGAGSGAVGYEAFLPMSFVASDFLVTHLNAGVRYTPSARNESGDRAGIAKYTLGGSGIFRVMPYFHLMLETIWSREDNVVAAGKVTASNSWTVLPGMRVAFNHRSGLQVVPGVGFPFGVGPSRGERGVFFYLSFEHPFNAEGRTGK
jgi:hypothetical protein